MEQAIQAVGVVASVAAVLFGFLNTPYTRKLKRRSKAIEEYEFIASFLAFDISKRPRLIVEQAFAVLFGHTFNYDQISHILKFNNPSAAFNYLRRSKEYLELRGGRLQWTAKKKPNRNYHMVIYFVLFLVGLYPATIGWLMQVHMSLSEATILTVWTVSVTSISIGFLNKHNAIAAAEGLIKEQQSSGLAAT